MDFNDGAETSKICSLVQGVADSPLFEAPHALNSEMNVKIRQVRYLHSETNVTIKLTLGKANAFVTLTVTVTQG